MMINPVAFSYLSRMGDRSGPNRGSLAAGVRELLKGGYVRLQWLSKVEYSLIKTDKGREILSRAHYATEIEKDRPFNHNLTR